MGRIALEALVPDHGHRERRHVERRFELPDRNHVLPGQYASARRGENQIGGGDDHRRRVQVGQAKGDAPLLAEPGQRSLDRIARESARRDGEMRKGQISRGVDDIADQRMIPADGATEIVLEQDLLVNAGRLFERVAAPVK